MKISTLPLIWLFVAIGCSQSATTSVNSNSAETEIQKPVSRPSTAHSDASVRVTDNVSYILEDGERYHEQYSDTFSIPPRDQRESIEDGQFVKLMFQISADGDTQTERMWVIVQHRTNTGYIGVLDNDPQFTDEMKSGLEVRFQPRHVIQIYEEGGSE